MAAPLDLHVHLALAEEVDLRVRMAVPPHGGEVQIAVIVQLEILREHVLAAVEFAAEFFLHALHRPLEVSVQIIPQLW